ncbi:hypothetical protein PAMP_011572 [Pampus punctatissimus]
MEGGTMAHEGKQQQSLRTEQKNEFRGELVNQRWTRGERTSSRCQASQRLQSRRPIMVSDKALQLPPQPFLPTHRYPHTPAPTRFCFLGISPIPNSAGKVEKG